MKKLIYIVITLIFTVTLTSCGSVSTIQENQNEVAGYTLKNKKQILEQKILNKKVKTMIATP